MTTEHLTAQEGASEPDGDVGIPLGQREGVEPREVPPVAFYLGVVGCVVHEAVEATVGSEDVIEDALHVVAIGDVGLASAGGRPVGTGVNSGPLVRSVTIDVNDHRRATCSGDGIAVTIAEQPGAAGDDDDPSGQIEDVDHKTSSSVPCSSDRRMASASRSVSAAWSSPTSG